MRRMWHTGHLWRESPTLDVAVPRRRLLLKTLCRGSRSETNPPFRPLQSTPRTRGVSSETLLSPPALLASASATTGRKWSQSMITRPQDRSYHPLQFPSRGPHGNPAQLPQPHRSRLRHALPLLAGPGFRPPVREDRHATVILCASPIPSSEWGAWILGTTTVVWHSMVSW